MRLSLTVIPISVSTLVELDTDETRIWKNLNAPYHLTAWFEINAGNLILEPGVEIVMGEGDRISLQYNSELTAIGTASEPIIFRGEENTRAYWEGLYLSTSDFEANNVQIQDAEESLYLSDSVAKLSNSSVSNTKYGVYCTGYIGDVDVLELGSNVTFEASEYDIGSECTVQ